MFKILFVIAVLFVAFYFNFYKLEVMDLCTILTKPYIIFPWQLDGQISSSTIGWLKIHLIVSLLQVIFSALMNFPLVRKNETLNYLFAVNHVLFTAYILANIHHFGEFNPYVATCINGTPLLLANILFFTRTTWEHGYFLYFVTICSPVIFESAMYIMKKLL